MSGIGLAVFPAIIMIGISVIAFVIYIIFYMLRINKTVRRDVERDELPGLEENPKKKLRMPDIGSAGFTIVVIAAAVCIVVCFAQLSSLKKELQNINNNYTKQIYALQNQLDDNYSRLEEMLKEKNSMFSSIDVKCGEYDKKTRSGEIIITVVPKIMTEDMKMTFNFNLEKFEGKRKDNAFIFNCRLDVFDLCKDDEYNSYISVTTSGETKNEKTPEIDEELVYNRFIPQIYVNYVYPEISSYKMYFNADESFCFYVNYENDIKINQAIVCFEKNGELFKTLDISSDFDFSKSTEEVTVPAPSADEFPVFSDGDEIKIYLVAKDSADITHTCYMTYGKCENGSFVPYEIPDEYNETLSIEE